MRPLEDRIAELERQLAVAVEALEQIKDLSHAKGSMLAAHAQNALAQIRGGASAEEKPVDTSRASA